MERLQGHVGQRFKGRCLGFYPQPGELAGKLLVGATASSCTSRTDNSPMMYCSVTANSPGFCVSVFRRPGRPPSLHIAPLRRDGQVGPSITRRSQPTAPGVLDRGRGPFNAVRRQGRMAMTEHDLRLWSPVYAWTMLGTWITITRSSCLIPRRIRFSRNATVRMRAAGARWPTAPPISARDCTSSAPEMAPGTGHSWSRRWSLGAVRSPSSTNLARAAGRNARGAPMSRFAPTAAARRGEI